MRESGGFAFKRNTYAGQDGPYTIDPTFLARVDEVVHWALNRDLTYEDGPGGHVWPY
jgi:hypothetical protein